jgi:hypothetical protein
MRRVAGTTELDRAGAAHLKASQVQDKVAVLPDYALPDSDAIGGNVFSGLLGTGIVLALCAAGAYGIGRRRAKA